MSHCGPQSMTRRHHGRTVMTVRFCLAVTSVGEKLLVPSMAWSASRTDWFRRPLVSDNCSSMPYVWIPPTHPRTHKPKNISQCGLWKQQVTAVFEIRVNLLLRTRVGYRTYPYIKHQLYSHASLIGFTFFCLFSCLLSFHDTNKSVRCSTKMTVYTAHEGNWTHPNHYTYEKQSLV